MYGCEELKRDSGTAQALNSHHYRCKLNPSNKDCGSKFCGKQGVRSRLAQYLKWRLLLSIIYYAHRVGRGIINSILEAISSRENASTVATVINFQWVEVILL
jgi:hypothetical protein